MNATAPYRAAPDGSGFVMSDAAFAAIAHRLEDSTGIVLSEAKRGLAVSRLARRLRHLDLPDFEAYAELLAGSAGAQELQEMILLLTTNVTRFFRERHHFDTLRDVLSDSLAAQAAAGRRIRLWSAGCSSGEEPYSMAMVILDAIPDAPNLDIKVLATDIDKNVIAAAQHGHYSPSQEDLTKDALLQRFVHPATGRAEGFSVGPSVQSLVRFAHLNLNDPWPMQGKFDVIFCRNVVIYFSNTTQQALWPRFAEALKPDGHLMIGHSERVTGPALSRLMSSGVTQYTRTP